MNRIYLDYAATTPLDPAVSKTIRDFELKYLGNPSSVHREGQQARAEIDFARAAIAKFLNAKPQEIIFTSGATEANNHAIKGVVSRALFDWGMRPHIITTELEHHSVYNVVKEMEKRGVVEATFIKPSSDGLISADQVIKEIKNNTVLISVIFVSNEIGSVLPIREIGKQLSSINSHLSTNRKVFFHVDAVQAAKFYNLNVEKLGCDLMTITAHKLYGPKGVGALYMRTGLKIDNLMSGGAQEYAMRPGTQNTAGIIGFAKAVKLLGGLEEREALGKKIGELRNQLRNSIESIPGVEMNGPMGDCRSPDNLSVTVRDIDQDSLITALDLAGIAASTGSACVSGSSEPSHVIQALGKITDSQSATVRFTLGKFTTEKEIKQILKIFPEIVNRLRK
ncbi:MAG: hypothetical protein A3H72_00880 [Candidatus Doudnabacteria bacterium RIFCSPLOWO2_02_FULL_48_8]|uniref:cysteine desulfurase n=1 Tax=Candidatus Doudnabacteria bacterium RIFCSPHIGHO2_01_FULL_46_24 TaxID=1817825 RepID=A0A1F5NUU4_9BACT|nr:MAG: hypothetical protein A2720_01095 [Candidatus Doudnabacteria bacterium RIFCSPHIGHO2_01_FULL_46_24]OGE95187.1 MAG: hypothetical protein A3H72_00880 [Candidatus Doudnabacteria bacterium RIFCSPLOWO2_02_FULL_48_8]OGE96105.1 MAG: hypothetical protein A3E98_02565 [Candidatus Doudnabacteria bacterium RIFCSPHIGHO2_12_FULL_48_11]